MAGLGVGALGIGIIKAAHVRSFNKTVVDANGDGRMDVTRAQVQGRAQDARIANALLIGGGAGLAIGGALLGIHLSDVSNAGAYANFVLVGDGVALAGGF